MKRGLQSRWFLSKTWNSTRAMSTRVSNNSNRTSNSTRWIRRAVGVSVGVTLGLAISTSFIWHPFSAKDPKEDGNSSWIPYSKILLSSSKDEDEEYSNNEELKVRSSCREEKDYRRSYSEDAFRTVPLEFCGVYKRFSMEKPVGDITDYTTTVYWIQTPHFFTDIRIPSTPNAFQQRASAGVTNVYRPIDSLSSKFLFHWDSILDYHLPSSTLDIGVCIPMEKGGILVEYEPENVYREIWGTCSTT